MIQRVLQRNLFHNLIQISYRKPVASFANYHSDSIEENLATEEVDEPLRLSSQEATKILRAHEASLEFEKNSPIKCYHVNYLGANNPSEDRQAQARICSSNSDMYLFGVFDGHGGPWCSDVVGQRLFQYISVCLQSPSDLKGIMDKCKNISTTNSNINQNLNYLSTLLLQSYHNQYKDIRHSKTKEVHYMNLLKHIEDTYVSFENDHGDIKSALEGAFVKLDQDLCAEAIPSDTHEVDENLLQISTAGSCACVALVKDKELYIANCGDARAILGSVDDNGNPVVTELSTDHNARNQSEIRRLVAEHSANELHTIIRGDRLLGLLMPFRAFGDIRFKWSANNLRRYLQPYFKTDDVVPPFYLTPPYLTAKPEITKHTLTPNDRFLVLATDGIWDLLSSHEVVQIISNHQRGVKSFEKFVLNIKQTYKLREIENLLISRQKEIDNQPMDQNSATDIIRHALAYTSKGKFDSQRLSDILTYPHPRSARDDMTITIVYFNNN